MNETINHLAVIATVLSLYAFIVISPGPNFILISKLALKGDHKASAGAILGFNLAAAFYAVLAMIGLAAVLENLGWLARAMQIAGGLYLIYLGITSWRNAGNDLSDTSMFNGTQNTIASGFRIGAFVNLANPKAIAFFVSLYAAAVPLGTPVWVKCVILFCGAAIEILWYGALAWLMSTGKVRDTYKKFRAMIDRMIGAVLTAFGLKLIAEKV